jgi:DNA-binding CsgD family transcriptional regulator
MTDQNLRELLAGQPLNYREQEALHGAALGETAKQTGDRLYLAEDTIRGNRKTAQAKLEARNITRAVVVAISIGALNLTELVED